MINAYNKGSDFVIENNRPSSMGEYIYKLVEVNPHNQYIEIDAKGISHSHTIVELYKRALTIKLAIKHASLNNNIKFIIISLESILDFIPAAWACIFTGIHCVFWVPHKLGRSKYEFINGLKSVSSKLKKSLIITDSKTIGVLSNKDNDFSQLLINIDICHAREQRIIENFNIHNRLSPANFLVATSGTTGNPKLVVIPDLTVLNRYYKAPSIDDDNCVLHCLPFHGILGASIIIPKQRKIVYYDPGRFATHPQEIFSIAWRYAVNRLSMTSSMATMVNNNWYKLKECHLPSLTKIIFGAETIIPSVIDELYKNLKSAGIGNCTITFIYGMTESGPIFYKNYSMNPKNGVTNKLNHTIFLNQLTSGMEIQIVDKKGQLLSEGELGHIQIRSEQKLFSGYYKDSKLTQQRKNIDGWFITADLGIIDTKKLTIIGREVEVISINARKIACEQIETPLRMINGLYQKTVIAAPYKTQFSNTDELAIFFVSEIYDQHSINKIAKTIVHETAANNGVKASHVVSISISDIERTTNNKVKRNYLLERYKEGRWKNLINNNHPEMSQSLKNKSPDNIENRILLLWLDAMNLASIPKLNDNFYDLGGDSIEAIKLLSMIEQYFSISINGTIFFTKPTVSHLIKMVNQALSEDKTLSELDNINIAAPDLLQGLQLQVSSWKGARLFSDSMIIGFNTLGKLKPIFWIAGYNQLVILAETLGSDQPIYGMSSIYAVRNRQANEIASVVNRYLWEILAIAGQSPFVLGGFCAGGKLALFLAQRLAQIGLAPQPLILFDGDFSAFHYKESVIFIYAEDSWFAGFHDPAARPWNLAWQKQFTKGTFLSIPGGHKDFDSPNKFSKHLARIISGNI